jgi:hypothetical protein
MWSQAAGGRNLAVETQARSDLRGLKALVGIMGVLIVLGTAVVIGVVIKRIYAKPAAPSTVAALPMAPMQAETLAPGEHVAGIAGAGGNVAVWVTGPSGDRVLLLNPQTGGFTTVLRAQK